MHNSSTGNYLSQSSIRKDYKKNIFERLQYSLLCFKELLYGISKKP